MIPLPSFETVIDASGVAPRIEAMLPAGARRRQLSVRTLLAACAWPWLTGGRRISPACARR